MKRHRLLIQTVGLPLITLAASAPWSFGQWSGGMNFRGPGAVAPGAGGFGRGNAGYAPFVGVYAPYMGGYNGGGYDPTVASVPSMAYFTYGRTSYTTESPSPLPAYDPRPAFSPLPPPMALTALLQVQVPPDAEVWLDGQKMRSTGAVRRFRSPPLNPAKGYLYEVRTRWQSDGKIVEDVRHTAIRAGATVFVDFLHHDVPAPASKGGTTPPKPPAAAPAATATPAAPKDTP
jgi:uncharacterized protein (TIGR03000 family)